MVVRAVSSNESDGSNMMLLQRREVLALAGAAAVAPSAALRAQPGPAQQLRIVDAHVHIWSGGTPTAAQRQQPVSKDQMVLEMREAGVDRAVIVPTSWDPLGNQTAIQAAQAHPDRFAVMGLLNIARPESLALIDTWKMQAGMLGVRLFLATPQAAAALKDGSTDWFWAAAERADLAVMAHAGGLLDAMARIAERHPRLRLCIDSLGARPGARDAAAFADLTGLLALAKLPNVAVKAEGTPTQSSEPYPYRNLHGYLRQIYDAFGPQRLFWGSDVTRLKTTSYRDAVTLFTEALPWLSDRDRELIMGRALSTWIGWPL
jgi:predicted TIM-barrel fold metal-dependent hydrolase